MDRLLFTLAIVYTTAGPVFADDTTLADLNKAKAVHAKEMARLRDKLLDDIDAVIKREADAGAGINYLLKERMGFADNWVVPLLPKLQPASRDYLDGVKKADQVLVAAYTRALTVLEKAGQPVAGLQKELRDLQGKREPAADPPPPKARLVAGTWKITFLAGRGTRTYVVQNNGDISSEDPKVKAKLKPAGGAFLLEFGDGTVERFTFTENRLYIEHFDPKNSVDKNRPDVMGIGELAKGK